MKTVLVLFPAIVAIIPVAYKDPAVIAAAMKGAPLLIPRGKAMNVDGKVAPGEWDGLLSLTVSRTAGPAIQCIGINWGKGYACKKV